MNRSIALGLVSFAILALAFGYLFTTQLAKASAPPGLMATIATSSKPAVSTTAVLIAATSTCNARLITTYGSPIMLTFSDRSGDVPSAITGFVQAASSTVAYDSGQYGCGAVRAYSFATQTIYVAESR